MDVVREADLAPHAPNEIAATPRFADDARAHFFFSAYGGSGLGSHS